MTEQVWYAPSLEKVFLVKSIADNGFIMVYDDYFAMDGHILFIENAGWEYIGEFD